MRKNLLVTLAIVLFVNLVSAQSTRVGITAGPVLANMFEKVVDVKYPKDPKIGITGGILLDVPMQRLGSFQTGVNFVQKGAKEEVDDGSGNKETIKININYIEVPMNAVFRLPCGGGKVLLGGGAAIGFAMSGKADDVELKFGDETTDDLNWLDFGLNGIAGYEFDNGFFIQANYNLGINRLFIGGSNKDKLYNRYVALRLGFLFGGKKPAVNKEK